MNYNLIVILGFLILLILLFWIIPSEKGDRITKNICALLRILPVSKIAEAIIALGKKRREDVLYKKVPPRQD